MAVQKKKNAHLWDRDHDDWYVEPAACSLALFHALDFGGPIWDPACGMGRIVKCAQTSGMKAVGSDIVRRTPDCTAISNFLSTDYRPTGTFDIVTNPPFGLAEEFALKALELLAPGRKSAFILPIVWMAGFSSKRDWLPSSPLKHILPISPRPSMPPGKVLCAGEKPGNGTKDFAWFVWEKGFAGKPELEFLNTNPHKSLGMKIDKLLGEPQCELKEAA